MNILSHEQMLQKQSKLLSLYSQSEIKFKFSLEELIQAKQTHKQFYCFRKPEANIQKYLEKVVPLRKRVQTLAIHEEQNALFKLITFVFLFIIYKTPNYINQYVKDQLRCSLYSDDVDLLEVRNHSFNKRMKSDMIKSVIAKFFAEIQAILQSDSYQLSNIKTEDLIAFLLQKNDLIAEGFHLFYRNILSKLQVQNASNCIEQVIPEQAISNLVEYFQIDCRNLNNLYLFTEVGVFILQIQNEILAVGRYYQNQANYQDTSEQEGSFIKETLQNTPSKKAHSFLKSNEDEIQKQDLKIFNFILDTDRNSLSQSDVPFSERTQEAQTPSFNGNQQIKFGKKKNVQPQSGLDNSFNKLKNRMQSQRINQISSEEQDGEEHRETVDINISLGVMNKQSPFNNQQIPNSFLDLEVEQEYDLQASQSAPTPMLGGNAFFNFGIKQQTGKQLLHNSQAQSSEYNNKKSIYEQLQDHVEQPKQYSNQKKSNNTSNKGSTIRRQSYQGDSSNKSKSSENKKQMKTSKNQIKVIDQTASKISLNDINAIYTPIDNSNQLKEIREGDIFQKSSTYTNCTCHLAKKSRFKLQSQILKLKVQIKETQKKQPMSRKISEQVLNNEQQNEPHSSYKFYFPKNRKQSAKTQVLQREHLVKRNQDKLITPIKETTNQHHNQQHIKSQQFLNFLKKDKSELIKKMSEKRHTKLTFGSGEVHHLKQNANGNTSHTNPQGNRTFVKQSMFVGSYHMNHNPQNSLREQNKMRAVTPNRSLQKKHYFVNNNGRERSITPTHIENRGKQERNLFVINNTSRKDSFDPNMVFPLSTAQTQIPVTHAQNQSRVNFVHTNNEKNTVYVKTQGQVHINSSIPIQNNQKNLYHFFSPKVTNIDQRNFISDQNPIYQRK